MTAWSLPRAALIGGREYALNTDYRDILEIISLLNEADSLSANACKEDNLYIALCLFYDGWLEHGDGAHADQAARRMMAFISCGIPEGGASKPPVKLLDWELDEPLIAAGVNRAAGVEVRALPHMHWHTFIGHYLSVGDGPLATVTSIRAKLAKNAKLEKWEQDFYRENKPLVDLRRKLTAEELAEKERLMKLLDN